jgi:hypothetical protein
MFAGGLLIIAAGAVRANPDEFTPEEEREHKEQVRATDPFISGTDTGAVLPRSGTAGLPLHGLLKPGLAVYMVQDADGRVVCHARYQLRATSDLLAGEALVLQKELPHHGSREVELWMWPEALKPRHLELGEELSGPYLDRSGKLAEEPTGRIQQLKTGGQLVVADYIFDRVEIKHTAGIATAFDIYRLPPHTWDSSQLELVLRELVYYDIEYPCELQLFDPLSQQQYALQIDHPERVSGILSAEGMYYDCWRVETGTEDEDAVYWIERSPPFRLVKFERGGYTLTLQEYWEE